MIWLVTLLFVGSTTLKHGAVVQSEVWFRSVKSATQTESDAKWWFLTLNSSGSTSWIEGSKSRIASSKSTSGTWEGSYSHPPILNGFQICGNPFIKHDYPWLTHGLWGLPWLQVPGEKMRIWPEHGRYSAPLWGTATIWEEDVLFLSYPHVIEGMTYDMVWPKD